MVTMFKPKPQLMRSVAKPDNVSTKELAEARPVYIDGLPEGGGAAPTWAEVTGKPSTFPPATHEHAIADVTGLQSALDGKAATSHTHTIANVSGLQSALDGKSATNHTHTVAQVTGLQAIIDDLEQRVAALEAAAE